MHLPFGIIMDEFTEYKPIVHKMSDKSVQIRQFHYYSTELTEIMPEYLYVGNTRKISKDFVKNCPRHIIINDDTIPMGLTEMTDTFIQIPGGISTEVLLQKGHSLFASYETWYNSLLMAVIEHKPLEYFLDLASQKLVNPFALFDNNLSVIGRSGKFLRSAEETIWGKIDNPQFELNNFYTLKELQDIAVFATKKEGQLYIHRPSADINHTYLSSHIWINDNHYGSMGMVDINAPFTEGQFDLVRIINQVLKLYFKNNQIYMRMAENNIYVLNCLLENADISEEIVQRYLNKTKWKISDDYRCFTFICPVNLATPVESIPYTRKISGVFNKALITVYQNSIIMITRCADHPVLTGMEKQKLEQFLKKNEMCCGISMVFNNFMYLRHYYTQSSFAAAQCKPPETALCLYENCQKDHVLRTLAAGADLRSFCHPDILSLWESGDEVQHELVRCLYHYFLNGRNLSATADTVHVHRNTLIYRLGKAEEILNIDIKQPTQEQAFLYLMSCLIVQHL